MGRVGSGQEVLRSHGSFRVGQEAFKYYGSGGRVGSGSFQISRGGSRRDPRDTDHVTGRAMLTRKFFVLTRGSDPHM